jgi:hypothetical protein
VSTLTITLPAIIEVYDYHEFDQIMDTFAKFGVKIKYQEVGFAGNYIGIFYSGSKKDPDVQDCIRKAKLIAKQYDAS